MIFGNHHSNKNEMLSVATQAGMPYTNTHKHRTSYFKCTLSFIGPAKHWKCLSAPRQKPDILAVLHQRLPHSLCRAGTSLVPPSPYTRAVRASIHIPPLHGRKRAPRAYKGLGMRLGWHVLYHPLILLPVNFFTNLTSGGSL